MITPSLFKIFNTDTSKKIIARLFIEGENVTSYLSAAALALGLYVVVLEPSGVSLYTELLLLPA